MVMSKALRQIPAQAERDAVGQGEALTDAFSDEANDPCHVSEDTGSTLLQAALRTESLRQAFKGFRANKVAAGVDGRDIDETSRYLIYAWPDIRQQLLAGMHRPQPVRRVTIPKPAGGERELGIPTVTDRLIQQVLLQLLRPLLDPTFSEHSKGFRPGRNTHDAVLAAQAYVQTERRVVVDVDLSNFSDRVNHDMSARGGSPTLGGGDTAGYFQTTHPATDEPLWRAQHASYYCELALLRAGWERVLSSGADT